MGATRSMCKASFASARAAAHATSFAETVAHAAGEAAEKSVPQGLAKANDLAKRFAEAAEKNVPQGLAKANDLAKRFAAALAEAAANTEPQLKSMDPETLPRLLDELAQMGFTDRELNERLLMKHAGNLQLAVRELVETN